MSNLRKSTQKVIDLVEKQTGTSVRVIKDVNLKTLATVRMAREDMPFHLIIYNPNTNKMPDYLICYECGFILRLYSCDENKRKSFSITDYGRNEVEKLLSNEMSLENKPFMPEIIHKICDEFFQGLMLQLRSYPVGMRVDSWIWEEYPELREIQVESAKMQMQTNVQSMSPEICEIVPKTIYKANIAMNGVFASFWSDKLSEDRFLIPYKTTKYWPLTLKLINFFNNSNDDPIHDCDLIDKWSNELGLMNWYKWIPYNF